MIEKRYLLLHAYKAFIYISIFAVIYVFAAGFFTSTTMEDASVEKPRYSFSLTSLENNSHTYFKTDRRELLVIKYDNKYSVFWANDPLYGCKLEFIDSVIKPVCIDIEYDLNGDSSKSNQKLVSPEYNITTNFELQVFP